MNSLGVTSILTAIGVTIVSLLSPSLTMAAPQCQGIFSDAKESTTVADALRELNRTQSGFKMDIPKLAPNQVTEALTGLRKAEQASESYLQAVGIKYETQEVAFSNKPHIPEILKNVPYKVFKIKEVNSKDEVALLLQGVLKNESFKDLEIIFDTGFAFEHPDAIGHFNSRENKIVLSYGAFTWRSYGLADTIRHEIQHAFEYQKVKQGKPSLSQFNFIQGKRPQDLYGEHYRLDEVEAHLRDLRFATGRIADRQMQKNPHPAGDTVIKDLRLKKSYETIDRIRSFTARAAVMLAELKGKNSYDRFENKEQGTTDWMFLGLKNDFYPTVVFTHKTGIDAAKEVKTRIPWAEQRLQEIASEVDRIEQSLPQR